MGSLLYLHLAGTVRMHTLMIQELSLYKKINTLEKLGHLWMIHHRDIQQTIIRHGIWRLTITSRIAYTHRHHSALDDIRVDFDIHLVVETLENHQNEREDERQRSGTEDMMGLATQIHNRCNESDVHTIKEVAQALLPLLVGVSDTSQVYLSHPAFLELSHRLLYVTVIESPEAGEIIHQSIRYHS